MRNIKGFQIRNSIVLLKKYSKSLVKDEKKYHKIYKKLMKKKFTSEHVYKLEEKYLKGKKPKEKKFNNILQKLSNKFYKELHEFITWYIRVFSIFDMIAIEDDKSEYDDLKDIDEIIKGALNDNTPFYGKETLNRFIKFKNEFIRRIELEAKIAAIDSKRAKYDKNPKHSFWRRRKKESALSKQILRIVKKKLPKGERKLENIRRILLEEIRTGTLKQDFLAIFQELLKYEENNIIKNKIIKKDIAELIKKHIDDTNIIMNHIKEFSAIASKYSKLGSEYHEDLAVFNDTGHNATKFVNDEYKNEGFIYRFALREDSDINKLVLVIEKTTKHVQKKNTIYYNNAT